MDLLSVLEYAESVRNYLIQHENTKYIEEKTKVS